MGVQVLDAGRRAGTVPEPAVPGRDGYPENPLMHLMYTSGSSGRPKGAEYTERHYCSFLNVRLPSLPSLTSLAAWHAGLPLHEQRALHRGYLKSAMFYRAAI